MATYARRRTSNIVFLGLSCAAAGLGLVALVFILAALLWNGLAGLRPAVFTEMTPPPGSAGGLLNAIYGSVVVTRIGHFSGVAGSLALALLVIPVVARTTEDMLLLVPGTLREAASAMGLPRSHVVLKVAYGAARPGLITGLLLAFARISGETAPLLFTALNNQFWNTNLNQPTASLPTVIFQFALSPYKDWQQLAWTGALIITATVLVLSIAARSLGSTRTAR